MKLFRRFKKVLGALLLALIMTGTSAASVMADDVPDYRLQISPAIMQIELKPGMTKTETFRVQNTGSKAFKFAVEVSPYNVTGDDYEPNYTAGERYNDIVDWVTFSQDTGEIEPGKMVEITATIKVPQDVPAGGQYAMIAASIVNDKVDGETEGDNSSVSMVQRVGILLYSSVEGGETRKEATVVENKLPSFIFTPPITATSLVKNIGNVHVEATYTLQVYPFFGGEEVYTNEENPVKLTILPETQRFNSISWDGAPALGIFRVKQTVKVLDQVVTEEKVVFLCPVWFLFIIILIIFCVIFWIVSRVRGRRD